MAEVARISFTAAQLERPFIVVTLDGDEKRLPVTFNDADLKRANEYEDEGDQLKAFFASYLGPIVYDLGDDILDSISAEWLAERKKIKAPALGE